MLGSSINRTNRGYVAVSWLTGLASIGIGVLVPQQVGRITRMFSEGIPTQATIISAIASLFAAQLALSLLAYARKRLSHIVFDRAIRPMTKDMYRRIGHCRADFFRKYDVEQLNTRILEDSGRVVKFWMKVAIDVPLAILSMTVVAAFMLTQHLFLGLCMLPLGLLSSYSYFVGPIANARQRKTHESWEAVRVSGQETLSSVSEFRSHGVVEYGFHELMERYDRLSNSIARLRGFEAWLAAAEPFVMAVQVGVLYWVGAMLCIPGSFLSQHFGAANWATIIEFMFLVRLLQKPMQKVSAFFVHWNQAEESIRRVQEIRDADAISDGLRDANGDGPMVVAFESVRVQGDGGSTLVSDISIDVRAGERVAFAGPSGCGKTTTINLLNRFTRADGGRVMLDGKPLEEYTAASLGRHVAVLPQRPVILSGTVRENILLGLRRPSNHRIDDDNGPIDLKGLPGVKNMAELNRAIVDVIQKVGLDRDIFRRGLETLLDKDSFEKLAGNEFRGSSIDVESVFPASAEPQQVRSQIDRLKLRDHLMQSLFSERKHILGDDVDQWLMDRLCNTPLWQNVLLLGLETTVGRQGNALSGGQQQKVALARALLKNPRLIVLDEALANLDEMSKRHVLAYLQSSAVRATILAVSHDPAELRKCSRILAFDQGRIDSEGTYEELTSQPSALQRLMATDNKDNNMKAVDMDYVPQEDEEATVPLEWFGSSTNRMATRNSRGFSKLRINQISFPQKPDEGFTAAFSDRRFCCHAIDYFWRTRDRKIDTAIHTNLGKLQDPKHFRDETKFSAQLHGESSMGEYPTESSRDRISRFWRTQIPQVKFRTVAVPTGFERLEKHHSKKKLVDRKDSGYTRSTNAAAVRSRLCVYYDLYCNHDATIPIFLSTILAEPVRGNGNDHPRHGDYISALSRGDKKSCDRDSPASSDLSLLSNRHWVATLLRRDLESQWTRALLRRSFIVNSIHLA